MNNQTSKKRSKSKLKLIFITIALICFGAFGMLLSGSTAPAVAYAEESSSASTYSVTNNSVIPNNGAVSQSVSLYTRSSTARLYIMNSIDARGNAGEYWTHGTKTESENNAVTNTIIKTTKEYYFGVGETTNADFFSANTNDYNSLISSYDLDVTLYSLPYSDNNMSVVSSLTTVTDHYVKDITTENVDTTVYYFTFILEYCDITTTTYSGHGGSSKTETNLSIVDMSNPTEVTPKDLILKYIEETATPYGNESSYEDSFTSYYNALGWNATGLTPVTIEYIKMKSFQEYEIVTEEILIPNLFAVNRNYVINYVEDAFGYNDVYGWNASYMDYYTDTDGTNLLEERIIRQAIGYDFSYTVSSGVISPKVVVEYSDFEYSDLTLRVTNNNPEDLLTMNVYTSDVVYDDGNYVVTWEYDKIQEQLYMSCQWLFTLTPEHINVTNESDVVNVDVGEKSITVTVPADSQDELFGLVLTANAEIIEDVEYSMTYTYVGLDDDLIETTYKSEPVTKLYSELQRLGGINFYDEYGTIIDTAINPSILNGEVFYKYEDVQRVYNHNERKCNIIVKYTYFNVIKAETSLGDVTYTSLNGVGSLDLTAEELGFVIPDGYRIENISSESKDVYVEFNEPNPKNSEIKVRTSAIQKRIMTVYATLTDSWKVSITYLKQYKNSAFSEAVTSVVEARVADYEDIYALTDADLLALLNLTSFDVLGLATVDNDKIEVTFNNVDTYNVDLTSCYTRASMRKTNSDGSYDEVLVPLTSYAVWTDLFGEDWSILWLNSSEEKIFNYENDIDRDKLYGFFTIASFEEKVSDLNSILSAYKTDGCKTIYESRSVKGGPMYKWFDEHKTSLYVGLLANVGLWFTELTNDENAQVYSYFLYLDGTSDLNYVANNGADDYDDTDNSIQNTGEDIADGIGNFFTSIKDWFTGNSVSAWIVKGFLILCLAVLLTWIIIKSVKFIKRAIEK